MVERDERIASDLAEPIGRSKPVHEKPPVTCECDRRLKFPMFHARHFFLLAVFLGVAGFLFATLLTFFLATSIIYLLEGE
jgi:hypothetical protein